MSTATTRRTGRPTKVLGNPPNRARELRLSTGKTIRDVAITLSIHPNALQRYEVNGYGLTLDALEALAAYYRTTVALMDPHQKNRAARILNLLD